MTKRKSKVNRERAARSLQASVRPITFAFWVKEFRTYCVGGRPGTEVTDTVLESATRDECITVRGRIGRINELIHFKESSRDQTLCRPNKDYPNQR